MKLQCIEKKRRLYPLVMENDVFVLKSSGLVLHNFVRFYICCTALCVFI